MSIVAELNTYSKRVIKFVKSSTQYAVLPLLLNRITRKYVFREERFPKIQNSHTEDIRVYNDFQHDKRICKRCRDPNRPCKEHRNEVRYPFIYSQSLDYLPKEVSAEGYTDLKDKFEKTYLENYKAYFDNYPNDNFLVVGIYIVVDTTNHERPLVGLYCLANNFFPLYQNAFTDIIRKHANKQFYDCFNDYTNAKYLAIRQAIKDMESDGRFIMNYDLRNNSYTLENVDSSIKYTPTVSYTNADKPIKNSGGFTWYLFRSNPTTVKLIVNRNKGEVAFMMCPI